MGPRAGLDDVEKRKFLILPGLELRPPCRPAPSQLLYRLRHPDSTCGGGVSGRRPVRISAGTPDWGFS
jgi:hypothetical protein